MKSENKGKPSASNPLLAGGKRIVDPEAKLKKEIQPIPSGICKCTSCGTEYSKQHKNFYLTNSPLFACNSGYTTVCKTCMEKLFRHLVDVYSGNEEKAVEHCCWTMDVFFSKDAFAMTNNGTGGSRLAAYLQRVNMAQVRSKGSTYIDTVKAECVDKIMSVEDIVETNDETTPQTDKKTIMFFGFGFKNEEYEYLDSQYTDWTTRYECQTKAQEELFKNLCIAQLAIQRAQRGGSTKAIADTMKTFQDLLGTANLKPSQTNDNALADQNTFGTLIRKWENEQPISDPEPEWQDVDGIKKMIDTFFLGHLCNLVHVQNDSEEAYREEMEKYTVKPPTYDSDEDSGETNILDKYSDRGDKP